MLMRSARARSASRYSATATSGNLLPCSGENSVGGVRGEGVAIRMLEHLLIAAHLLVTGESLPSGKLCFRRRGRGHDTGRFVSGLRHTTNIARIGCYKRPRQNRGPSILESLKPISANRIRRSDAAPSAP